MTDLETVAVDRMMGYGLGYIRIAKLTGISPNTLKNYCKTRNIPVKTVEADSFCGNCGKPIWLAATQSPPGLLIQTTTSPSPAKSSSRNICGVTSSSNQLSSAMVPYSSRTLSSAGSASAWLIQFQNFLF